MGRWRPPRAASSPYITAAGAARLKAEARHLWQELRPEVVRALSAAAAEGDRSENAEYIYRKKQLGEIDRRLRYLGKRIDSIQVVDAIPNDQDVIRFGAWLTVLDVDNQEFIYRIVGADETDATAGWISVDSPVARALLGKKAGDTVRIELPEGPRELEVVSVEYRTDPT